MNEPTDDVTKMQNIKNQPILRQNPPPGSVKSLNVSQIFTYLLRFNWHKILNSKISLVLISDWFLYYDLKAL